MYSIFLRVLNQHLNVSQAFYNPLFFDRQMLMNFFTRAIAFNCSNFVFYFFFLCFCPFLNLFTLLVDETKARADELILKQGYLVFHSEVYICMQLQQQTCDTLTNFPVKTIYRYLPQTLNAFHCVRLSFNHDFDSFWIGLA